MHNAVFYSENNVIHKRDIPSYLEQYTPMLKWKKNYNKIMDIGSADGSVTALLQKFLPPNSITVGCDISKNMVKFATENHSSDQISFIELDIAGVIPEAMNETFDHIFSWYTLNWVRDQTRAFKNIFNLLERNGECLMVLVAYNPVFDVYRILEKDTKWSSYVNDVEKYISPYHDSKDPCTEITELMKSTGFVDVYVKSNDKLFLFDDEDKRMDLMSALSPFVIPKDKIKEFRNDYNRIMNELQSVHKVDTVHSQMGASIHYRSVLMYGRKPLASEQIQSVQ